MYIWQDRFAFIILITVGFSLQRPVIDLLVSVFLLFYRFAWLYSINIMLMGLI